KHGTPIRVRQFCVAKGESAVSYVARLEQSTNTAAPRTSWTGNVEPIPFPFRLGISGRLSSDLLDFDAAGSWLLAATQYGVLQGIKTDGSTVEMLPRGMLDGQLLAEVHAVLGVVNGFVVAGATGSTLLAFHYDFPSRACKAHVLGDRGEKPDCRWYYLQRW